ncbi:5'-nucleotidase, lipoprotein e(P4) family [Mannheimia granulomatis]|uniref:5'-nucleotidase, lipoprotein e(P4) family n=1 Tax=Mannheimia granulomatis TaxID=85402 RepID=A0A6G8JL57_9PAST|nr:5'-nucleotidase, lipoprotein e(P4) family [Mannheimia granulomatis]QIM67816.1 5'-nucleotidase, lipoprotein e(P4) family [Mannheimia granulomatis]
MKKRNTLLMALFAVSLTACSHTQTAIDYTAEANAQLQQQTMLAVNWVQQSGEYDALAYQAFNSAKQAFDQAKVKKGKKKAVVVDLDETMIDNSAYAGWQIAQGKPHSSADWVRWTHARQATAIAGAVEFNNYVNRHGGKVFYVSNRSEKESKQATADNLVQLGFSGVDDLSLLLKQDKSAKAARFAQITEKGYEIVLFIGDNLNDFGDQFYGKSNAERKAVVAEQQAEFGRRFIVLPNPTYGDWEGALGKDYRKADANGKMQIRANSLNAWDGQ